MLAATARRLASLFMAAGICLMLIGVSGILGVCSDYDYYFEAYVGVNIELRVMQIEPPKMGLAVPTKWLGWEGYSFSIGAGGALMCGVGTLWFLRAGGISIQILGACLTLSGLMVAFLMLAGFMLSIYCYGFASVVLDTWDGMRVRFILDPATEAVSIRIPYIVFFCAGPVLLLLSAIYGWRHRRRGARCSLCDYPTTGLLCLLCPECGTPVNPRRGGI